MAEMGSDSCYQAALPRLDATEGAKHLGVLGHNTPPMHWTSTLTWAQRPPKRSGQRALPSLQKPGAVHFRRGPQRAPRWPSRAPQVLVGADAPARPCAAVARLVLTLIPFAPAAAMLRIAAIHLLHDDNMVFCSDGSDYSG